jgi:hypothetical protein
MPKTVGLIAVSVLLFTSLVAGAAPRWRAEAALGYDSNLNNAPGSGEVAGAALDLGLGLDDRRRLRSGAVWDRGLRLQLSGYPDNEALSAAELRLQTRYRQRWGRGFSAPIVGIGGQLATLDAGGRLRDRSRLRIQPLLEWPLTTTLSLHPRLSWQLQRGRSPVFEGEQWSLGLDLELSPRADRLYYAGLAYQDGDVVLSGNPPAERLREARAAAPDPAFPGQIAYRLEGRTELVFIGVNRSLRPGLALDLQARAAQTRVYRFGRYERYQLYFSLLKTW